MAIASVRLVVALRDTASRLELADVRYAWSHYAHCNCGHLARTLTGLTPHAIYEAAFRRPGDWGEQAAEWTAPDYGDRPPLDEGAWEPEPARVCGASGMTLDVVLERMFAAGLEPSDVRHLERLSDPEVLRRLDANTTGLVHNVRENVVAYLRAWAEILEEQLAANDDRLALAAE